MDLVGVIAQWIALGFFSGWLVWMLVIRPYGDRTYDRIYAEEYRRLIRKAKADNPELAAWIDAETIRHGEGVIE